MTPQRSVRLPSIDALRGIAALAVVAHHAVLFETPAATSPTWFMALYRVAYHGFLGVPLFFVISGFCIHLPWARAYRRDPDTRLRFGQFWRRRLWRLYPPYFVALCGTMALVVGAAWIRLDVPLVTNYPEPRPRWMAADFLAHATMLHGLHPVFDKGGGNAVYWSLAREEYLYLMYLPLLALRRRAGLWPSLLAVTLTGLAIPALFAAALAPESPWWSVIWTSAPVLWVQWVLGMAAAEAYCGLVTLPRFARSPVLLPLVGAAALASQTLLPAVTAVLWGIAFFVLLNAAVGRDAGTGEPSGSVQRWLAKVGVFSYSLYLVHQPVRAVGKQLLYRVWVPEGPVQFILFAGVLAAAGYWLARAFFVVVERRFLQRGVAGLPAPQKAAVAASVAAAG